MRVLFFAQLKDVTGCDRFDLPLASPVNSDQLWAMLLEKFPRLADHRSNVRLARNWEYAESGTPFTDLDETALIPPVSGG
jgi:molybdopterin synthase sulfur carrier subunit